jgi:hypothetical protein
VKFVVRVDPLDFPALHVDDEEFDQREDARLSAERYAGKVVCPVQVIEYDDAGNEVRMRSTTPRRGGCRTSGASAHEYPLT